MCYVLCVLLLYAAQRKYGVGRDVLRQFEHVSVPARHEHGQFKVCAGSYSCPGPEVVHAAVHHCPFVTPTAGVSTGGLEKPVFTFVTHAIGGRIGIRLEKETWGTLRHGPL